jgi:hypothetical protein
MFRSLVLLLLAAPALATTPPPKHKPAPPPVAIAVADADASAKANADAKAASLSVSNAEGGDAKAASVATGGKAVATGGESNSDASSNSGGNSLTVNENQVRQAPGLAQGSFAIVGCGFAANAGGSGAGGAGFLGLGFTPEQCYDFMLANAYCTAGATQACCEVLNASKAGRRAAARGVTLPVCRPPAQEPPAPAPEPQAPIVVVVPGQCCDKPDCPPSDPGTPPCYEKCEKACKHQCDGNAACEKRCEVLCKRRCDGQPPSPAGSAGTGSCPAPVEQSKAN